MGYKPLSATVDVIGDDGAPDTLVDVEDDGDDPELALICVVDVEEGVVYIVAVLSVMVALTPGGGGGGAPFGGGGAPFGGGGGSCPSRTALNGGDAILTVAHCCVNQIEVDSKSAASQVWEIQ